jgi:hypothetical protein
LLYFPFNNRRFGFPNRDALDEGRSGTDCRGEEHDVIITWSVTSGKRQIMMNGKEVHYASNRTGIMDHSWSSKGNHVMKIVCHAAAPMTANPGFRQYDLFIDGQSFFTMPKVYELGVRGAAASSGPVPGMSSPRSSEYNGGGGGGPPSMRPPRDTLEEERELQRAINASLEESRRHLEDRGRADVSTAQQTTSNDPDLFEFDSAAHAAAPRPPSNGYAPPPQQQYGSPPPQHHQQQYASPPPQQQQYGAPPPQQQQYGGPPPGQQLLALPPSTSYGSQPPVQQQQQQYAPAPVQYQSPAPVQTNFAPPAAAPAYAADLYAAQDPFAPKPPSRQDIANEILGAYGSSTVSPTGSAGPQGGMWSPPPQQGQQMQNNQYQQQQPPPQQQQQPQPNGHGPALTMGGFAKTEEEPLSEFEAAMKKLVNVDRIDEPAAQAVKLTMKKVEDEKAKKNKGKSRGLPPVATGQVGSAATLGQISSVKPETPKHSEGIMKAPPQMLFNPNAAQAGALVIHGQGPPPLQQQGFGVGFNNGYAPQQQQQYQYR